MAFRRTIVALTLAAALGACSSSGYGTSPTTTTTPPVATSAVSMSNLQFTPSSITVAPGTVVTWTNHDNTTHNVTFSSTAVTSIGDFSTGSRTATMPTQTGTYSYRCTIHSGMSGTVVVQ